MNFAQALARIEELLKDVNNPNYERIDELRTLLQWNVASIVQLGKVAAEMRDDIEGRDGYSGPGAGMYDKLMKG